MTHSNFISFKYNKLTLSLLFTDENIFLFGVIRFSNCDFLQRPHRTISEAYEDFLQLTETEGFHVERVRL